MRHYITLTLAAFLLAATLPALAATVKIGGYVQSRYTDALGAAPGKETVSGFDGNGTFNVRRARISTKATIDENTMAAIEIDAAKTNVSVKQAFISYAFADLYTSLGLTKLPFGYENQLSSSAIIPLERSMISNMVSEYGTGLFLVPSSDIIPVVKTKFAVINGEETDTIDKDNNKVAIGNVEYPFGDTKVGVSYLAGHGQAANAYVANKTGRFTTVAEYTTSKYNDKFQLKNKYKGFYVLEAFEVNPKTQVYARYDELDQDNTANFKKTRITAGVAYLLNDTTELTAEYQSIDDDAKPDVDGAVGVQLQTKF
jgi:hypothetical protein